MQLVVNVQLKPEEGGVQGECIYIDTEGSFLTSRLIDIARKYDIESISKGIHLFRVLNHIELIALVRQLPSILKEYTNVKLIIIDSIAYHFRLNTMDSKKRTHFVNYIGHSLVQIATKNKLAASILNIFTKRLCRANCISFFDRLLLQIMLQSIVSMEDGRRH
jgi:RAD51-like protein 2